MSCQSWKWYPIGQVYRYEYCIQFDSYTLLALIRELFTTKLRFFSKALSLQEWPGELSLWHKWSSWYHLRARADIACGSRAVGLEDTPWWFRCENIIFNIAGDFSGISAALLYQMLLTWPDLLSHREECATWVWTSLVQIQPVGAAVGACSRVYWHLLHLENSSLSSLIYLWSELSFFALMIVALVSSRSHGIFLWYTGFR